MANFNLIDWIATALVITAALNLGTIGIGLALGASEPLYSWNPISILFENIAEGTIEAAIYILIGLAGLYEVYVGYKFSVSK